MARNFTAMLLTVWLGLGLFIREPHWVFLPLWGLFPGDCSFHGSLSHVAALWRRWFSLRFGETVNLQPECLLSCSCFLATWAYGELFE